MAFKIHKNNTATTIIEALIVVTVLGLISAVMIGFYQDYTADARFNAQRQNVAIIREAIARYFRDHMTHPTSLESLQGPYIHQNPGSLFDNSGAYTVMVQISDIADDNIYHVAQEDRIWVPYTFGGNSHGGKQIGDIKLVMGSGTPPPFILVNQGDSTYVHDDGGTDYVMHVYSSVGTQNFDVPATVSQVDVLIVAGGGGGGGGGNNGVVK